MHFILLYIIVKVCEYLRGQKNFHSLKCAWNTNTLARWNRSRQTRIHCVTCSWSSSCVTRWNTFKLTNSSGFEDNALKIILWEVCWEYLLFYRALNRENLMEEIWINVPKFISPYLTYFVSFVKKQTNKLNAPLDVLCYVITRMTLIISRTSSITFPFRSIKI